MTSNKKIIAFSLLVWVICGTVQPMKLTKAVATTRVDKLLKSAAAVVTNANKAIKTVKERMNNNDIELTKSMLQSEVDFLTNYLQQLQEQKDLLRAECEWWDSIDPRPIFYQEYKDLLNEALADLEATCASISNILFIDTCTLNALCLQIDINSKEEQFAVLTSNFNAIQTAIYSNGSPSSSDCFPKLWNLLQQLLALQTELEQCKEQLDEFRTRLDGMQGCPDSPEYTAVTNAMNSLTTEVNNRYNIVRLFIQFIRNMCNFPTPPPTIGPITSVPVRQ